MSEIKNTGADTPIHGREASLLHALLDGRTAPVTVGPATTLDIALELMLEHDYSQLPVVDSENRPIGLLTQGDILRAIRLTNAPPKHLTALGTMSEAHYLIARVDDMVDHLIDHFERVAALLVVDESKVLVGIVTPYDTTTFLRKRSADLAVVQRIEVTIKHLIRHAYTQMDANLDEASAHLKRRYWDGTTGSAIRKAMSLYGGDIDRNRLDEILTRLRGEERSYSFEHLSFSEYQALLLGDICWKVYAPHAKVEPATLRNVLEQIRLTRNKLAHPNEPLRRDERDRLEWFDRWLDRMLYPLIREVEIESSHSPATGQVDISVDRGTVSPDEETDDQRDSVDDDDSQSVESPLEPLTELLRHRRDLKVEFTFDDIGRAIGRPLPPEADDRLWWSNIAPHADAWLEAGYSVTGAFTNARRVRFARTEERKARYLDFFGRLANGLEQEGHERFEPKAANWNRIGWIRTRQDEGIAVVATFTRARHFQLVASIDVSDGSRNEAIFEQLRTQEPQLDLETEGQLIWRQRNNRPGARPTYVVAYRAPGENHISDPPERQVELLGWAIDAIPSFMATMRGALRGI